MDISPNQPRWFTSYSPDISRQSLDISEILLLDTIKSSLQNNVYALRDLLDSLENFLRGRASIPETVFDLSRLFVEQPFTIHAFTTLLPKEIYLDDTRAGNEKLGSNETLGVPHIHPEMHDLADEGTKYFIDSQAEFLSLATQVFNGPNFKATHAREGERVPIPSIPDLREPQETIGASSYKEEHYTSLASIRNLSDSKNSGPSSAASSWVETRKSSGSTDYGYFFIRRAFSMEYSPSVSGLQSPRNFERIIHRSPSPITPYRLGSQSPAVRGSRSSDIRSSSPVLHFDSELGIQLELG